MRTGRSLRHSLRCRSLTERIRQPDTSGNRWHGGRDCGRRRGRQGSGGSAEHPRAMKVKVMGKETMVLDKETRGSEICGAAGRQ